MKKVCAVVAMLSLLSLGVAAQATITIDTVAVGDKGNVADRRFANAPGYGSVNYNYNIGKYEVTAGQYTAFLNAVAATDNYGLYSVFMATPGHGCGITRTGASGSYSYSVLSDWANNPVNCVSYWDSCRFANWLSNGQGTGTETGTYTLNGYNGSLGTSIERNSGAKWAVASHDEWYKAAYYKGGSTNAGYWLYTTKSDTAPGRDMADASGNNANYFSGSGAWPIDPTRYITRVGEFQNSTSYYGTFDQGGNMEEWNESVIEVHVSEQDQHHMCRGARGGSYGQYVNDTAAWAGGWHDPNTEGSQDGCRVVQVSPVPEPSSIIALAGGLLGLITLKRRKAEPFIPFTFSVRRSKSHGGLYFCSCKDVWYTISYCNIDL